MKIQFVELPEHLRLGGLEKAAQDLATFLCEAGMQVVRGAGKDLLKEGPDLVHFHGLWSPDHYRIAGLCKKQGFCTVVSPHGMLEPWAWKHRWWKKWPYFYLLEKRRLRNADALLATAPEEAINLRRFFPSAQITAIPLGIEPIESPGYASTRESLGWGPEERVFLYLSRVHPKKGLKELLEALLDLVGTVNLKVARLVIIGEGPSEYVQLCQALAKQLRQHMRIDWLPSQWGEGKWNYLAGADLFCLPTYSENFGIVILEAGIGGTAVFTTTGTPWKCIEEAGFGWVPEPQPETYPQVLKDFLDTPAEILRQRSPSFAKWIHERFSWPNLIHRYVDFYQSVLIRKGSS